MNFINITAKNFLSFKELSYNFTDVPVLVQGQNYSDDGQESNGACKSGIFNIIELCLFGDVSRDQLSTDLINFDEDLLEASLEINCPLRNQSIKIERRIHRKQGGGTQLTVNNILKYKFEDKMVKEINDFIIEWMGLNKKDIQNYFLINGENSKPFFKSSNTENIELINRFSNAKLIDGIDKDVQVDVVKLEAELKLIESNKTSHIATIRTLNGQVYKELNRCIANEIQEEIEIHQDNIHQQIESIKEDKDFIEEKTKSILSYDEVIKVKKSCIKKLQKDIAGKNSVLEETSDILVNLKDNSDLYNFTDVDDKLSKISLNESEYKLKQKTINKDKREIEEILSDINKNLTGAVQCPKCNHEFIVGDPDVDIEGEKEAKIETEKLLEKTEKSIKEILAELDRLDSNKEEVGKEKVLIEEKQDKALKERQAIRKQIEAIETEIKGINTEIKVFESSISSYETLTSQSEIKIIAVENSIVAANNRVKYYHEQIELAKEKTIDKKRIEDLWVQMRVEGKKLRDINHSVKFKKSQLFETKQWIYNFRKFQMNLANKFLKVIQGYCNKFLMDMGSDIQMRIEGYKQKADGSLSDKITPYIIRGGIIRKYGTFSKGERGRVNLVTVLAIVEIINRTHKHGGLSNLMCDEFFEGLDSKGLGLIMKSVERLRKPIMLTTHVTDRSVSSNILLVRKENGVSKLILN